MSPAEFMSRVVAWPQPGEAGVINTHYQFAPKDDPNRDIKSWPWAGRPFNSLTEFMSYVYWLNGQHTKMKNVFYCMSQQVYKTPVYSNGRLKVSRSADQATFLKSIWLDVDVKTPLKGYSDLKEAVKAIILFCRSAGIPEPTALVGSGGGVHAYWISDKPLSPDEWRPYAEGLKALAITHGLRCDAGVTSDPARILRIPGTFNFKETVPREVRLIDLKPTDFNFATQLSHLAVNAPVTATVTKPAQIDLSHIVVPQVFKDQFVKGDSLSSGIDSFQEVVLDWGLVEQGCPFFKDAKVTGGKDHSQPLWNLVALSTTFFKDGDVLLHEMSNQHPGYVVEKTDELYARKAREQKEKNLGWPSCKTISGECKLCAGCPHFGKIKAPLELGRVHPTPAPHVNASQSRASLALSIPDGDAKYFVDEAGFICEMMKIAKKGGPGEEIPIRLFNVLIQNPRAHGLPRRGITFDVKTDKDTWERAFILAEEWATLPELTRSLMRQGVIYNFSAKPLLEAFFVAWLTQLNNSIAAAKNRAFGWVFDKENGKRVGFSFGGKTFYTDGHTELCSIAQPAVREMYEPMGTLANWRKAFDLVHLQGRLELDVLMLTAWATPLLCFTGGTGGTCAIWGTSGTNKTSASQVMCAVWGDPQTTKQPANATSNSIEGFLADIDCLPVLIDDIQEGADYDSVCRLMFDITKGRDKSRMKQNGELRFPKKSKSSMLVTANNSIYDHLFNVFKAKTDAHPARCIEIEVPSMTPIQVAQLPGRIAQSDAERVFQELERNRGLAGIDYAKWLTSNLDFVDSRCAFVAKQFERDSNMKPEERFWKSFCSSIICAAEFVEKIYPDIVFDHAGIKKVLLNAFMKCRARIETEQVEGTTQTAAEAVMAAFLNRYYDNQIWTYDLPVASRPGATVMMMGEPKRTPVVVQWCIEDKVVRVTKSTFIEFMTDKKYPQSSTLAGLKNHLGMKQVKVRLAGGTKFGSAPMALLEFPVTMYSWWEKDLYRLATPEQTPEHVKRDVTVTVTKPPIETGFTPSEVVIAQVAAAKVAARE